MMKKKKCPFKKNAYSLLLLVCGMLLLPSIVLAEGKETGIYYFRESWIQDQELLKATFPADPLIPMQSNPVHYLRRGAKAVEILDIGLDHSGKEYHLLSLYDLIPVLAVNRDTTKAEITGWSDLNKYDLTVGIDSNSDMLLLGMSQGLDKDWRQIEQSKKLMQDLHTRGKLLFSGNQGFTAGKLPDVMILFDKQARALQASGANLEIVFPSEGTVAFPVALLSKKPLHLDTTVLQAKLSEAVYQADRRHCPGRRLPRCLTASVLAKAVNGPILLSYPDRVNDKVLAEISCLGARNLLLIGGEEAMHASTAQAYAKGRNAERIGGKNRYDTAGLIADTITQRTGKKTQAMIATGENFPDALAISGPASRLGTPILLVRKNGVPEETKAALTRNGITQTIVIGGEEAIPAAVAKALPGATQRLGGKNRYDTAAVIAKHFHKTAQTAYLATGEDFPDALTAGLIAGKANAPLLLTNKSILRAETVNYLKEAKVEKVIVVGGPEAITEKVVKEIK